MSYAKYALYKKEHTDIAVAPTIAEDAMNDDTLEVKDITNVSQAARNLRLDRAQLELRVGVPIGDDKPPESNIQKNVL
ncbi:hypothetical protein TNCV_682511 [Trichonephila clavipes]|nr:hypothetical protein TNCV_682511 [Trichonephila clavipes]